jgi:rubrerythrin
MVDAMPGLFYVPGSFTLNDVRKSYKSELDAALAKQRNWYSTLIRLADALWARSSGNPLAVSDTMRLAAKEMNAQRDWMKDFKMVDIVRCRACGSLRNPAFPVCPTCKAIDDPVKAKELGLSFAQ